MGMRHQEGTKGALPLLNVPPRCFKCAIRKFQSGGVGTEFRSHGKTSPCSMRQCRLKDAKHGHFLRHEHCDVKSDGRRAKTGDSMRERSDTRLSVVSEAKRPKGREFVKTPQILRIL